MQLGPFNVSEHHRNFVALYECEYVATQARSLRFHKNNKLLRNRSMLKLMNFSENLAFLTNFGPRTTWVLARSQKNFDFRKSSLDPIAVSDKLRKLWNLNYQFHVQMYH